MTQIKHLVHNTVGDREIDFLGLINLLCYLILSILFRSIKTRLCHNCLQTGENTKITRWDLRCQDQGAVSIRKTVLPGMAIPMLKIRRPNGRLIFNMEITIRR